MIYFSFPEKGKFFYDRDFPKSDGLKNFMPCETGFPLTLFHSYIII